MTVYNPILIHWVSRIKEGPDCIFFFFVLRNIAIVDCAEGKQKICSINIYTKKKKINNNNHKKRMRVRKGGGKADMHGFSIIPKTRPA